VRRCTRSEYDSSQAGKLQEEEEDRGKKKMRGKEKKNTHGTLEKKSLDARTAHVEQQKNFGMRTRRPSENSCRSNAALPINWQGARGPDGTP